MNKKIPKEYEKIDTHNEIHGTHNKKANAKQIQFKKELRSVFIMTNKTMVPEARAALDKFKMEAAAEVGVNLKQGYNGDLTSKEAGSVGGQMVKEMIRKYEESMK